MCSYFSLILPYPCPEWLLFYNNLFLKYSKNIDQTRREKLLVLLKNLYVRCDFVVIFDNERNESGVNKSSHESLLLLCRMCGMGDPCLS